MRRPALICRPGWPALVLMALFSTALITPARVEAQAPGTAAPSEISPYVEDTTIAIARLDLDRIDWEATADWEVKLLQSAKWNPQDIDKATAELRKQMPHTKKWAADFVRAGGRTVYVVARLNQAAPAYAVVPLPAGADPKVLGEMLKNPFAVSVMESKTPAGAAPTTQPGLESPLGMLKSEVIGKSLYFGPADTLADLHDFMPAPRPELEQAFAAAGDAPVKVAFNPPEGLRTLMVMSVKKLPDELGGGPVTPVSSGLRWAALSLRLPSAREKFSLSLAIQAKDAAAAKSLSGILDTAHQALAKEAGEQNATTINFLFSVLAPKATAEHPDQLRLSLDDAKMQDMLGKLAGPILAARRQATRVQSANNERQITLGIMMYANDHNGVYPKDLPTDLKQYLGVDPKSVQNIFTNPLQPTRKNGYAFVRPANKMTDLNNVAEIPIVYEAFDQWSDGVNVAFADGHVEFIKDKEQFDKFMKNNPNAANGAAGPKP